VVYLKSICAFSWKDFELLRRNSPLKSEDFPYFSPSAFQFRIIDNGGASF
jgi:hypothetical protein